MRPHAVVAIALCVSLVAPLPGGLVASEAHGLTQSRTAAVVVPVRAIRSVVQPARIPVGEPSRVRASLPAFARTRPKVASHVRALNGMRVVGPPMLGPNQIDAMVKASASRRSSVPSALRQSPAAGQVSPAPLLFSTPQAVPVSGVRRHGGTGAATVHSAARSTQSLAGGMSGTGINPWWRYQEEAIPGGGKAMVNVGTGNLVVQDDDMAVAHKGLALAFRRTYNAQSGHDVNDSDGAGMLSEQAGLYGNGWTNTFDAHMARSAAGDIFTVFDIDGARYDYTKVNSTYVPGAGDHNTLAFDGNCGFMWTKKSGTTYYFYRPNSTPVCAEYQPAGAPTGGYAGRLYQIIGRNRNTSITFSYAWDNGDASATGKVSSITATTESGQAATLYFGDVNGHRLLQVLLFPDGQTQVTYGYDASGNLVSVLHPSNNAAGVLPDQAYGYQTIGSDSVMLYAASPRTVAACAGAGGCYSDGGGLLFGFAGTSAATSSVSQIQQQGVVNWALPDGTNSGLLQGAAYPSSLYAYDTEYYTTGVSTPTLRDTAGHMTNWVVDTLGRPTQTQECTASSNQGQSCTSWLWINEGWDADNNLISQTDARGYETDYAYDAHGNAIAVAAPATTTSQGTFRPTKLYDYDMYNNVVAYCDESETHLAGADWTSAPTVSDSLCSSHAVPHMQFVYTPTTSELFGELTAITTPLGYSRHIRYDTAQQGGVDYGLPTSVTGDPIMQLDGTTVTPTQTFWYDGRGNLGCYSKGSGIWVLQYDGLSRLTSVADPDDSSADGSSICGKTSGTAGENTRTTYQYFPDGSKLSAQTPSERAYGVATTYTYDLDGNVTTETAHHGCVLNQSCPDGTTQKFYDGADRLVEVKQPHDPRTFPATPMGTGMTWPSAPYDGAQWITRYLYDISGGSTVSLRGSAPFYAFGNLYKTQTWLGGSWTDLRGSAYDPLDRETSKFAYGIANGGLGGLTTTQLHYDTGSINPGAGLLTSKTNPNSETASYAYDELGRILQTSYSTAVTPTETNLYDPSGRIVSATSSAYGTEQHTYDADGRLTQVQEPTSGGVTSPALLTYAYYGDGQRSAVSIQSTALNQTNALAYSYRTDGALQTQALNAIGTAATWSKTYTDGGRLSTISGIDTQSRAYDAGGQLANYTTPSGTVAMTYDPEGSPLTEALPNVLFIGSSAPINEMIAHTYNVRGELLQTEPLDASGNGYVTSRNITDAGFLRAQTPPNDTGDVPDPTEDTLNGVTLGNGSFSNTTDNGQLYPGGSSTSYNFDQSGRLTSTIKLFSSFTQGVSSPNKGGGYTSPDVAISVKTTTALGYDTENRTQSQTVTVVRKRTATGQTPTSITTGPTTTTIGWGPNGHPIRIPNAMGSNPATGTWTLHWDGDMILFATDDSGQLVDFKIGLDGDITPHDQTVTGLSVYDRDVAGVIVQQTNASGRSGYIPSDASTTSAMSSPSATGFVMPTFVPAQFTRPDGFPAGTLQISGVRAFHPDLGAWTTPDAYEGDIRDPASQQRYMWNRGNPVDYNDPSGYSPDDFKTWIQNMLHPGRSNGSQSGPLSDRNIAGIVKDLERGTSDHIEKFRQGIGSALDKAEEAIKNTDHAAADKFVGAYNDAVKRLEAATKEANTVLKGFPGAGFRRRVHRTSAGVRPKAQNVK